MKSRLIAGVTSFVFAVTVLSGVHLSAQQTSSSSQSNAVANSMRVTPVRTDLALDPGDSKTIEVSAQNLTPETVNLRAILSDFEASKDESGEPLVIMDDSYAESHSLKRLATISPEEITLGPNQTAKVAVTITAPQSARAGGYYGTVRFTSANQIEQEGSGVAVATNVGSLVLLRINGDLVEKMSLASVDVRQKDGDAKGFFSTNKDLKVVTRFNNEGNIQLQPYGKIQILDRSGKVVEEHEVNGGSPRGNVLPESIRRFETKLDKVGTFGKYTLQANFGYGEGGQLLTAKSTFWVVPTTYIIGGAIGLLVLAGIIFLIVRVITLSRRGGGRSHGRRY